MELNTLYKIATALQIGLDDLVKPQEGVPVL
jgi:hypothetical protein